MGGFGGRSFGEGGARAGDYFRFWGGGPTDAALRAPIANPRRGNLRAPL